MWVARARERRGGVPRTVIGLFGVVVIFTAGCGPSSEAGRASTPAARTDSEPEPDADAIAIEVAPVRRDSMSAVYATSATLRADKQATVTARTRGVVREILVEEGDRVDAQQSLAILEDDEQRILFQQAKAAAETMARELERAETLHRQGLIPDEEYETTRREAVDLRHAADLAELELSRTVIRAPFAGQVLVRHLDPGANVTDGTAVFDLADLEPLYADVQVPERQVAQLSPGQVVRVAIDDELASGATIERIAPSVDPETGTVKVTVAVSPEPGLRPGSFVRIGIVTATHDDAVVVPRSALVAEGRRWLVYRLAGETGDVVEQLEVTRGFEEGNRVEIVTTSGDARPLDVGDRIVVTGASSLSDGAAVEVLRDESAGDEDSGVTA